LIEFLENINILAQPADICMAHPYYFVNLPNCFSYRCFNQDKLAASGTASRREQAGFTSGRQGEFRNTKAYELDTSRRVPRRAVLIQDTFSSAGLVHIPDMSFSKTCKINSKC
jgi:hypothetical protein